MFRNPILSGFYPDPSICRVGGDYYLVTSSFEYFPGVPVFHSRDLMHWRQIGHCLTRDSQLPLRQCKSSRGIYAPTIRHHAGRFYMITTNTDGGGHFIVQTDNPAGEWSEPIRLKGVPGIDPSLFFDDDGSVYFTSTAQRLTQARIDLASGKLLEEFRPFWKGTGGASAEAPHLYKINGTYYALLAEGGTEYGHMVTIARGPTPYGPWETCPHNPILTHRSIQSPIQATGHADLIKAHDGSWWLVCLGIRPVTYPPVHHLGRETFLAPLTWKDGWPIVNGGQRIGLEMESPAWQPQPWPAAAGRDDFDQPTLALAWNFRRNPVPASWSLTERPGYLRLRGSAITLDDQDAATFIGQRQRHFFCEASTWLEFEPERDGDEAGLTVLMNDGHHYEVAVTRREGEKVAIVRRRIGTLSTITSTQVIQPGPVELRINAEPKTYGFSIQQIDGPRLLDSAETRYLATEVAGGFTGVYFGLYATGHGQPASATADFDWFQYVQTQDDPTTIVR